MTSSGQRSAYRKLRPVRPERCPLLHPQPVAREGSRNTLLGEKNEGKSHKEAYPMADGIDNRLGAQEWFSIGYVYREEAHLQESIDAYDKSIRLKPDFAEAFCNRGIAKHELDRHDDAIADYDTAIRLKPDLAEAFHNRGVAKSDLDRHNDAIADYDAAIRLKPNLAGTFYYRACAYLELYRADKARRNFERARELAYKAGDESMIYNVNLSLE